MNPVDPIEASQVEIPELLETQVGNLWQRWRQQQCPDFSDPVAGGPTPEQAMAVLRYDQCQRWQARERVPAEKFLQIPQGIGRCSPSLRRRVRAAQTFSDPK
jgi:hypothetical protein